MNTLILNIALNFQTEGEILTIDNLGEGFINDTYIIKTSEGTPDYILQRKNKRIFSPIPAMMDNIQKVCTHIKKKVENAGGDPMREAMTIIYWAVCLFIDDTIAYNAAETPELATAGGKGIGKFQSLVADLKEPLVNILPGFHDIRYRFKQWDSVLAKDPVGRKTEVAEEISWIESRRDEMLAFYILVENGTIPTRISHNDTKINNILFDKQGEVLCVIDLDTVLSSTVLNDFGDAIRFYTNTGLEDDLNLENVSMDMEIFKAFTKGYLSEAKSFLTEKELVLRFLMDYIDGDNYYKTKSAEHNLVRTRAQYKLLQSIETQFEEMNAVVKEYSA